MNQKRGPLALIIIDGWGYSARNEGNAIALAATPFYDELCEHYPQTLLEASGTRVGLPAGVMGNSEVGHLNLGAGRVIRMDVSRVDHDIATGEFFRNPVLLAAINHARTQGTALHLMGLVSDGQVHSSQEHLYALLRLAKQQGQERVFIHCFLDGRDTPPSSAADYIAALTDEDPGDRLRPDRSIIGRYYAMDRDKHWERTERAYDLLVRGKGERLPIRWQPFEIRMSGELLTNLLNLSWSLGMMANRWQQSRIATPLSFSTSGPTVRVNLRGPFVNFWLRRV